MARPSGFRGAVLQSSLASFFSPAVGVLTAPVVAQALGADGRGEAAVATAPGLLLISVAALGLPEALTYNLAKSQVHRGASIAAAVAVSTIVGAVVAAAVFAFAAALASNDPEVTTLIKIATLLSIPGLYVGIARGVAASRGAWTTITLERLLNGAVKLVGFVGLAAVGHLDVLNAVIVGAVAPVLSGLAYVRRATTTSSETRTGPQVNRRAHVASVARYGLQTWYGNVAVMVQARLSQFLVAPLSDVRQLGVLVVAITIADVPYLVVSAIRDVVFSHQSAESDPQVLARVTRITLLLTVLASGVIALSTPYWVVPLFGPEFADAVVPVALLLLGQVVLVPVLILGAGIASSGSPLVRSITQLLALVGNVMGLLVLVPPFGAVGAALATVLGAVLALLFTWLVVRSQGEVQMGDALVPRLGDLRLLFAEVTALIAGLGRRHAAGPTSGDDHLEGATRRTTVAGHDPVP